MINIGIDLGTTNSVIAYTNVKPNGDVISNVVSVKRPVDMYNAAGGTSRLSTEKKATLPSCVYYVEEKNYAPIVGDFAKMQYSVRPHLVAKSIKSQMGKPYAEGLSPDIPDKTPAQISSQILKHLIKEASLALKAEIKDAIITVPANFDSAMCQATKEAASLAGIKVKNNDGSDRPILLSEPNAVIYDLFNQIRNGEVPSTILDLSNPRKVLVFDIGGGTLDITMHEIKRRDGKSDSTLKVDEIATNRYTLLGGDDFDELIAEKMFERYVNQYKSRGEIVTELKKKKASIMPQLRVFAENLKIELNESVSLGEDTPDGWGDEEGFSVGGNIHNTGYAYDDTFTQEEIEDILSVFMGNEMKYDDYKHISGIKETRNIIYPILDVLDKAQKKLNVDKVVIDAVIVNGGMSKFYMIIDRLTNFFGFEPITLLDPDQAVARGAAVYHYLLTNVESDLTDDMKKTDGTAESSVVPKPESQPIAAAFKKTDNHIGIEWGKSILNDCLYLGLRNGVKDEIIPTGAELPYLSEIKTGYQIQNYQNEILIPIQSKNLDGTFRTISKGKIIFNKRSRAQNVAFQILMDVNKVITLTAWTYETDPQIKNEMGSANIAIDNSPVSKANGADKIIAPSGSVLNPTDSLDTFVKLCNQLVKTHDIQKRKAIAAKIRTESNSIYRAANKKDFSTVIIKNLNTQFNDEALHRLFTMSRKMFDCWTEEERKKIASLCLTKLGGALNGMTTSGMRKTTNIQAIYTLGFCGSEAQLDKLSKLHNMNEYQMACLYAHAVSKTSVEWIIEYFNADIKKLNNESGNHVPSSAYALGIALHNYTKNDINVKTVIKLVEKLYDAVKSGSLVTEQLTSCVLALGWICDQRSDTRWDIPSELLDRVYVLLDDEMWNIYNYVVSEKCEKPVDVACKMINGDELSDEDEQFLLEKLNF
ncbi:Hsp70 family protein [Huintestinicola sp.]